MPTRWRDMVSELEQAGTPRRSGSLRRRAPGGRPNKVTVVFTDEEFAQVSARALGQRVTVPHYLTPDLLNGR